MTTTPGSKQFNVILPDAERTMLNRLSIDAHEPAAQVIRKMIRHHYDMQFANQPTCVTGAPCKCPHMHILTPSMGTNLAGKNPQ